MRCWRVQARSRRANERRSTGSAIRSARGGPAGRGDARGVSRGVPSLCRGWPGPDRVASGVWRQGLTIGPATAVLETLGAVNRGFALCPTLTVGAIEVLVHHGTSEQQAAYLPHLSSGAWTGAMNLTEPQACSDVGALKTSACRDARITPIYDIQAADLVGRQLTGDGGAALFALTSEMRHDA